MNLPLCPHCHKQLPKFPTRKGQCPKCKHAYLVRTDPETKEKVVVDATGAKRIEKIYHRQAIENELERNLSWGVDDFDGLYKTVESQLTEKWIPKFGRGPGKGDVLWGVASQLNLQAAKVSDFSAMSRIYFNQALYIHQLGKDCNYLLKPANEMTLRELAKSGFKEVSILANKACTECAKLDGKKFTIQEALEQQILPNTHCTFKLEDSAPTGWCRCLYQALPVDFSTEDFTQTVSPAQPQPTQKQGFFSRFKRHV